ncbi:hypothetical protein BC628DRAFT_1538489 [Trametes gibbosa]|nr:hypothetical protein BC628DRAFT_1538489 [Trametes gibbosa]
MFSRALFVLSVLGTCLAVYTPATVLARDENPSDQDLLASCPGGPGSGLARADRCTLASLECSLYVNIVNNPQTRLFSLLGDVQLNCGGSSDDIDVTLGGQTTVGSTTTISADIGIEGGGLSIGGGIESSIENSQTISKQISFTVKPGRQAVFVAGTAYNSQTGNVQVNFGSRQLGHFIWITGTTVTQLSPVANDVVFDVHETACGTNPRDLNNSS